MNDLRTGRRSGPDTAINEPESACLQEASLLAKDLQRYSQDNPRKGINDWQSLIKRSAISAHIRMLKAFALLVAVTCVVGGASTNSIPPELCGAWATDEAEMQGGLLVKGSALYINTNGNAACVAAWPPVGMRCRATYSTTNLTLTLILDAKPSEGLIQSVTNRLTYRPRDRTLVPDGAITKDVLKRRSVRIPTVIMDDLK